MNRKIQPEIKPIEDISIQKAETSALSNGVPLHTIHFGEEEVIRLDCMFRAGNFYQDIPLVASFTNQLLKEGTSAHSSTEIAEKLDFYGSWLHLSCSYHYAYVTLYSLNKYLPQTIRLIEDIILNPVFPEKEFQLLLNSRKQQYLIEQEKVQYLAHSSFLSQLYGSGHPYGRNATPEDFERLNTGYLKNFHQRFYNPENCQIIISGKITDPILKCVNETLGHMQHSSFSAGPVPSYNIVQSPDHRLCIEKPDSIQSAIYIGRPLFNRKHPDYHKFRVLNTLFGGYFGSRLMSNIREDKGYTYGISSGITTYPDTGHFAISSQTGTEFSELLIQEVYKEMERLRTEPVPEEELTMVKNYMLGEHIRMFDGGFALADAFISLLANELDYSFYEKNATIIRETTASDIQDLACTYFDKDSFYEVIAGGKKGS
jgi:predicted Zn-dependent peptidase